MDLITPKTLCDLLPLPQDVREQISFFRKEIANLLSGKNQKIAVVVGPCSLHDPVSALEYAHKLKKLSDRIHDSCLVVMRAYVEKPRTKMGWKGYLYDPFLDGSQDIAKGVYLSRKLLLDLAKVGLPLATEFLDPLAMPYYQDLISWGFIGARTSSSTIHRQMASSLAMPVGFKNSTEGSLDPAIHGIMSAREPHRFISISDEGQRIIQETEGNPHTHLVLRGGKNGPNYEGKDVGKAKKALHDEAISTKILIDCSHGNSRKIHTEQPAVLCDVLRQISSGNSSIAGVMLESFLEEGNQSLSEDVSSIKSSVSITDSCIDWSSTEKLLLKVAAELASSLSSSSS